jgi:hypothetical protein
MRPRLWTERNCGNPPRHFPVCYPSTSGMDAAGHLRCEIVEGHRYADDPEPSRHPGHVQYPAGPYDSGIHERPSGAFRLPEQQQRQSAGPYGAPESAGPYGSPETTGSHARPGEPETRAAYDSVRVPVRGPEYPTIPAPATPAPTTYGGGPPESLMPIAEPTSLVPPIAGTRPRFEKTARRPVSSFIVAGVMVVLLLPVVRLLLDATFTGTVTARNIVPAVLLTLGFTLTGIGLFAVAGGRPLGREAWLRPPVAYLPAGLILLLAAGLAVA